MFNIAEELGGDMSIFDKVLQEHEAVRQAKVVSEAEKAAKASADQAGFLTAFNEAATTVARPIFQSFVDDAIRNGFPAALEHNVDGNGRPCMSVRFAPECGARLGVSPIDECIFSITALPNQKVRHASHFDQRDASGGKRTSDYEVQSINKETLERHLAEFLKASLDARANL